MTSITQFTAGKRQGNLKALRRGCVSSAVLVALLKMADSRIRQTANVRFKLRISQNRKWADKNSSKQFLWIKNCVKQLICVEKMISKWQGKTWPRGENSRRFAVKTCDGVRVTSCRHPHINILGNIADNDFFSKIQKILCLSLFKLRWAQKELNWKKENSNTRRDMLHE